MAAVSEPKAGRPRSVCEERGRPGWVVMAAVRAMIERPWVKAVWLEPLRRRVSVARERGHEGPDSLEALRALAEAWGQETREDGASPTARMVSVPAGLRLVPVTGSGVMLQRDSCPTAPRFWVWTEVGGAPVSDAREPSLGGGHEAGHGHDHDHDWRQCMAAAVVCGVATGTAVWLDWRDQAMAAKGLYALAYVAGSWFPAQDVWENLRHKKLDVHFLMLCVAAGALATGHWWEGAILLFLFTLSEALEGYAAHRTEREIQSLFKDAPREATLLSDGEERRVPVEDLLPGGLVRVRPGEGFPVDGEIVEGTTAADESNLTGESEPVEKGPGDRVFSGTLNVWGSVDYRVTRTASESALAKVMRLIREAQESKAPAQRFTDRFGTGFTYLILGMCGVMFLVWWLVLGHPPFQDTAEQRSAFYRAMALLVVASPCALVLSIPSAVLAGIAAGARRGVLFRGGAAIERLAEVRRVAVDKTGTLTTGQLRVVSVESAEPGGEAEVVRVAAALAEHSTHPVSLAIARHARLSGQSRLARVEEFRSRAGLGLEGSIRLDEAGDPVSARLGRRSMFEGADWSERMAAPGSGESEAFVEAGRVRGRVLLRDEVRASSAGLIRHLAERGLRITMLTGDRADAARLVADDLGPIEVRSGLTPEDKVEAIRSWKEAGEVVAMVGDGVNDAPSLAAADVAVGMGVRGSDAALEQADVVLMNDRLENFGFAYHLSCKARAIIRQNLLISLGVIGVMVAAALGMTVPLTAAVLAHEGSTVVVVLNSLRLLFETGTVGRGARESTGGERQPVAMAESAT